MSINAYRDVKASVLKLCTNFIASYNQLHPANPLVFFNFEAAGEPHTWPETDAMGPAEIEVDLEHGSVEMMLSLAVTTAGDPNLFRLDDICNLLANLVRPGASITVYDAPTGAPIRPMKFTDGTRVGATERTDKQPVRLIMCRGLLAVPGAPQ